MQHNIVAPRDIDPAFPEGLEQIILAMLTKEPGDRFQTAGAAERALRGYLFSLGAATSSHDSAPSSATSTPDRYVRSDQRRSRPRACADSPASSPPARATLTPAP
jgi:hypothetical protein